MLGLARVADKAGTLGSLVAALGCAGCFPAVASLGAAVGLGFLAQWEGLFINTLLPAFAALAFGANAVSWYVHRVWARGVLGLAGPSAILLTLYPLFQYAWSTYLFYAGLALMLGVAFWDLLSPPRASPRVRLRSTITCPECGARSTETMPTDACQYFYECPACHAVLRPRPGDCCVFCSYGDVRCPPKQLDEACCQTGATR